MEKKNYEILHVSNKSKILVGLKTMGFYFINFIYIQCSKNLSTSSPFFNIIISFINFDSNVKLENKKVNKKQNRIKGSQNSNIYVFKFQYAVIVSFKSLCMYRFSANKFLMERINNSRRNFISNHPFGSYSKFNSKY
ncbi:hypothetical protein BpHYR1_054321 [Brachionus plicatilis]|uniref:Uncharacterized protein n=1 Tax=Brachionus plicatilis TaxID=10195 RepID=A0A3M7Q2J1_BRAPC|nr:hypothetical protein BpHYR1_054321 [Brachionus plicatilis]